MDSFIVGVEGDNFGSKGVLFDESGDGFFVQIDTVYGVFGKVI